ncbi:MAG: phasin family protein [Proteobacteria bacterium]|nr:phasin family protein [Pseudomonadota bacterium]
MTDQTFDVNAVLKATRDAFAPVIKAQQESFKTLERLARLQYAVAGDVLESGLARVNATLVASSPSELLHKHTELTGQFVEKLRSRAEEFASVTTEIQAKVGEFGADFAAKAVPVKKAA